MTHAEHDPIEENLRTNARPHRFAVWLQNLRSGDPAFAEASALYPDDMGECQADVYLFPGCDQVWSALGSRVLKQRWLAPAVNELEHPRRGWSSWEHAVIEWAAHFWDVDRRPARCPYRVEQHLFHRWMTGCHPYRTIAPALTITARRGVA